MSALGSSDAWAALHEGNRRFVDGAPAHPNQNSARRADTAQAQTPMATLFGCSDSRLSAEIIFDVGLGDLFVVRNMGQIISDSVVASLEYAAEILEVPLVVVLAHDSCGAVNAAIQADGPDPAPLPPHIQHAIDAIIPSVRRVKHDAGFEPGGEVDPHLVGLGHLKETIATLLTSSELISEKIADGTLAIVGATYALAEGVVSAEVVVGDLEPPPTRKDHE